VLLRFPGVREAVAAARPDEAGGQQLTAYVVTGREAPIAARDLRDYLKRTLPFYMVPSAVVFLEALPLTPNGKIDLRALPLPSPSDGLGDGAEGGGVEPRSPMEATLSRIWAEVLNLPKVGIRERFFDLGGHSIQAVRMLTKIRREFETELPLSALFQAPSVEEMAALLTKSGAEVPWSPLVAFQSGGTRPPFFAIHGGHGEVLFYKALAEHLGPDQPFYALRAKGNDFPDSPHRSVEEMASEYIRAIRTIQPEGPYRIGGASFGGIVAFEVAQQLHAVGVPVEQIVLFDTGGFRNFLIPLPLGKRILNLFSYFPRYGFRETWHRLKIRFLRFFVSESVVEFYRATGTLPDESSPAISTWEAVWAANNEAADHYVPASYPGEVTLIRAIDDGNYMWFDYERDYGWSDLVKGGVHGYDVPGTHIGMFQEPYVRSLARTLGPLLNGGGGAGIP
jgi:thioesterase domain-containing protein/acyl carrier protein